MEKGYNGRGRGWPYLPQNGHHMALLVFLRVADNTLRLARLSNIAMLVLIVPHSNAKEEEEEEHVFHDSEEQDTFLL